MKDEYIEKLQGIGLNSKQARAYLALLELGRGSAASVASRAGLKPPTAYVILKELIARGFVRKVPKAKKQLFIPESPDIALSIIQERVANFKTVVPALEALIDDATAFKTKTLYFEGLQGLRRAYAYRQSELHDCEYLAYFASAEDVQGEVEKIILDWSEAMADANVTSRAIVPDHVSLSMWRKKDTDFKRTVKIIPTSEYYSKNAIEIFPYFVRITLFGQLQCTIIEDAEFVSSQRQIFEMVWKSRTG